MLLAFSKERSGWQMWHQGSLSSQIEKKLIQNIKKHKQKRHQLRGLKHNPNKNIYEICVGFLSKESSGWQM